MKLIIDERLKNRLIGLAVIISIGTIFAPAIIKKSSQQVNEPAIAIQLPPQSLAPTLAMPEKQLPFQQVKVAHVQLPDSALETKPKSQVLPKNQAVLVPKVETVSDINELRSSIVIAAKENIKSDKLALASLTQDLDVKPIIPKSKSVKVAAPSVVTPVPFIGNKNNTSNKLANSIKSSINNKPTKYYAIQIGTFAEYKNAIALINRLKNKGYLAFHTKITNKHGTVYRVMVGQLNQKKQAVILKKVLADAIHLQGIIVTTRIS